MLHETESFAESNRTGWPAPLAVMFGTLDNQI